MKTFRLGLIAAGAFVLVGLGAADALAQNVPNVPGNGAIRRAIQAQIQDQVAGQIPSAAQSPTGLAEAFRNASAAQPTLPPLPNPASDNSLSPSADGASSGGDAPAPASSRSRGSGSRLPRTGLPVLAVGLLGVALLSGGRMLVELVRPFVRPAAA